MLHIYGQATASAYFAYPVRSLMASVLSDHVPGLVGQEEMLPRFSSYIIYQDHVTLGSLKSHPFFCFGFFNPRPSATLQLSKWHP